MSNTPAIDGLIAGASAPPQLLFIARYVAAIVAAIKAEMPQKFKVAPMPDKVKDFDLGTYDGAVVVHYKGAKYKTGTIPGLRGHQARTLDIDVHVLVRGLEGQNGAYDALERLRLILQGRRFEGAGSVECLDDGMVHENDGIWDYVLSIRAEAPAVAQHRDERSMLNPAPTEAP